METNDQFREQVRREGQLIDRLRLATERLEEAQQERIWAVVESHQAGLSIRQIAAATGLSRSRVHQLLGSDEASEIPRWLSQRRGQAAAPCEGQADFQARLAAETTALRQCREWLRLLQRGERVIVNLRPESDPETEYVAFDGPRVLRVLGRVIADMDALAGLPPRPDEDSKDEDAEARRIRHRERLAEPEPQRRLSVRGACAATGLAGPNDVRPGLTPGWSGSTRSPDRRSSPGAYFAQKSAFGPEVIRAGSGSHERWMPGSRATWLSTSSCRVG